MVKVTRVSKVKLINEFGTNTSHPSIDARKTQSIHRSARKMSYQVKRQQPKFVRQNRTQSIDGLGKNLSYQFENNYSKSNPAQNKSMGNEYFPFANIKHHPIIVPSMAHENNNGIDPNNQSKLSSSEIFESKTQLGKDKPNVWPEYFFFYLTLPIVLGIGAVVTIIAVIISEYPTIPGNNWLINGDVETGPCEPGNGITRPTGWDYNDPITQIYYNNMNGDLSYTDPGPSDRGNCYFYGQTANTATSMWQRVNISDLINPFLIDNQKISFNLSAWLGGYSSQDDNARVSLAFMNRTSQQVGSTIILGPILAADRGNITSLIFQLVNGLIPAGARSFIVTVLITCVVPVDADGLVDNIALVFYT